MKKRVKLKFDTTTRKPLPLGKQAYEKLKKGAVEGSTSVANRVKAYPLLKIGSRA